MSGGVGLGGRTFINRCVMRRHAAGDKKKQNSNGANIEAFQFVSPHRSTAGPYRTPPA